MNDKNKIKIMMVVGILSQTAFGGVLDGRYEAAVTAGNAVLELAQPAESTLTGRLTMPDGTSMTLSGVAKGGDATGLAQIAGDSERFALRLRGQEVQMQIGQYQVSFTRSQPAPTRTAAPVAVGSAAGQWGAKLQGKKLHYFSRYNGGSSGGYAEHKYMGLCSDGSFFFKGDFSGSINVPGATASMGRNRGDVGRWSVGGQGAQAVLQLIFGDGSQAQFQLASEDGKTYLNRTRWLMEDATECR